MALIHCLTHAPFEGPAAIAAWAADRGHALILIEAWHDPLPERPDALIVMGGPMGVADAASMPWLAAEQALIASVIGRGCPVLGVCLGAQLITSALGAVVTAGANPEIGWFPIQRVVPADDALVGPFPSETTVFHWHEDACALPDGARLLWRSEHCAVQGYAYDKHVLALQCHLEVDRHQVDRLLTHCGASLRPGATVQDHGQVRAGAFNLDAMHAKLYGLLDRWWVLAHSR